MCKCRQSEVSRKFRKLILNFDKISINTYIFRSSNSTSGVGDSTATPKMAEEMDDDQSSDLNENDPDEAMDVTEVENNRFQKENHLLKNLPYYKELQAETEEYLDKIITNLVNTILSQDFQIGVTIYTKSLKT